MRITVHRDAWGVPHLRAEDSLQLAFAQGFSTALDRAWQLEVERHRACGTSAAFLGADSAPWDVLARRARLADTARRCLTRLERLEPDTAAWVRAYADGVTAGLPAGARRAPQFTATGLEAGRWEPWTPLAVWLSTHLLFAGFPTKLWRELAARRLGGWATELFAVDGPGTAGSNGWLVGGGRTATGAALIAGDPHRFLEDPGVYQQIRLACPEFDVVGLAVPGVPGIAHFGHTGDVAWAITNAMADYQDLYAERLRRTGDGTGVEALGPGGWEPAHRHVEHVEVAGGGEPVEVEVIETARGPVVLGGPDEGGPDGQALSLRCPPRVREDLGFAALPALLRARTVADVDRALTHWAEPVNVVLAADTAGGTLHRVAGAVPHRDADNRLRPVPAWEERHTWRGWHEPPRSEDPLADEDVAVMANERGLAAPLGVEFAPPHRARRIRALLTARTGWRAADMAPVHTDTHLASAEPLLRLLAGLDADGLGPAALALRGRLLAWDRHMDAGSRDATAYARLRAAVVRSLTAHPALQPLHDGPVDGGLPLHTTVFAPWLAVLPRVAFALETLLTTPHLSAVDRSALVRDALEEAAAGPEPEPWGARHRPAPWQALPTEEEWPQVAGDHDCVLSTSSVPGLTDRFVRGPSARYVWDLARREDSLWCVPLGASGVPGDPHHRDQLPLWARGEPVPVVTDWDRLTEEHHEIPRHETETGAS